MAAKQISNNQYEKVIITFIAGVIAGSILVKFGLLSVGIIMAFFVGMAIFLTPKYFILFWLIIAAISNKVVLPGKGITSYGLMNILFLPFLSLKLFIDYKKEIFNFPVLKYYFIFLLAFFISIWYSPEPYFISIRKYLNFIIPLLFSILMTAVLKDYITVKRYLKTLLISVALLGLLGIVMFVLGKWVLYGADISRAPGVFGHPNDYAIFLNINLSIALALSIILNNKKDKILYFIIFLILAISLVPTFTKGAYISFFIIVILTGILSIRVTKSFLPLIGMLLIIAFISAFAFGAYSDTLLFRITHHDSFIWRINLWKGLINKIIEHPIKGYGFMSSFKIAQSLLPVNIPLSTHNLYLRILIETGIIGLVAFLLGYFAIARYMLSVLVKSKNEFTKALAMGGIVAFISLFFNSFTENCFFTPMINFYFWFYFSFTICFYRLELKKQKRETDE